MDGEGDGGVLEGDHLDGARVAGDRGDLPRVEPLDAGDAEPRHLPHVALAVAVAREHGEVPGAEEEDVAALGAHALGALGGLEVGRGDHFARSQSLHAARTRQVEEDAARHDAARELVDRVARGAGGAERGRGHAVVEPAVVVDVRQAVPLGRALERHADRVVRVAGTVGIGAQAAVDRRHGVDRVRAPALADLRPVGAEGEAQAEDRAPPDARRRAAHDVRGDEVDGAALVVRAPAPPVGDPARDLAHPGHRCGSSASAVAVAVTSSRWFTHWSSQRT